MIYGILEKMDVCSFILHQIHIRDKRLFSNRFLRGAGAMGKTASIRVRGLHAGQGVYPLGGRRKGVGIRRSELKCHPGPAEREHGFVPMAGALTPGLDVHMVEVTPGKKVVWSFADHKTMKTISSVQLLDVSGDVTRGEIWH